MNSYNLFIGLTVATIVSQTIHTWYVFQSFSRLEGFIRVFQAVIFCAIISISIFAFVIVQRPGLALLGAFVEMVINMYYYALDYFEKGIVIQQKSAPEDLIKGLKKEAIKRFWRKNWIAIFFGLLLPVMIYIFADQIIKLNK